MTIINIDGTTIKFSNGMEADFAALTAGNILLALDYVAAKARLQQQLNSIADHRNGSSKPTIGDMLFGTANSHAEVPAYMTEAAQKLEGDAVRLAEAMERRILPTATPAENI